MKKFFLFSGLLALVFMSFPEDASAKKRRYRYIKRQHGLHANFDLIAKPTSLEDTFISFSGAYHYNHKGLMEFGPYLSVNYQLELDLSGGLLFEYNFIKNTGKRKMIPSIGLRTGFRSLGQPTIEAGLYGSLKYFVARRTAFVGKLEYAGTLPVNFDIGSFDQSVRAVGGFTYYFDFY